jgi:hypothetical protein
MLGAAVTKYCDWRAHREREFVANIMLVFQLSK